MVHGQARQFRQGGDPGREDPERALLLTSLKMEVKKEIKCSS